jgi:hypothetical protein
MSDYEKLLMARARLHNAELDALDPEAAIARAEALRTMRDALEVSVINDNWSFILDVLTMIETILGSIRDES